MTHVIGQVRAALARITGFFAPPRADDDVREELEAHLEMETAEYVRRGMSPRDARRQALMASGGITQAVDAVRAQRGLPWIESLVSDTRNAFRALGRAPAFTAIVVLTLGLGIGANTAIFSVVRGVLLKPLPHQDGDRLVVVRQAVDGPDGSDISFSIPEVRDLRERAPALGGIAEYSSWFHNLQTADGAMRLDVGLVTGNYFEVMGLSPALGRLTQPTDDGPAAAPVMVLTHEFWQKRFGADSGIVGRQVRLDGREVTVIGVLQPAPFFPDRVHALLNMVVSPHHMSAAMVENRSHRMTEVIARLAPGATVERARAEVAAVHKQMQAEHAEAYDATRHPHVTVVPFKEALGERARLTLWLLMGAAAFVMIISAANVANLTLMRGVQREHELVVRVALGAGVRRLRRWLLVENLVLTSLGGAVGVLVAIGGVGLLVSFAERYSPRASEIRLDLVALGFALALSVAVAFLLSFAAALPAEGRISAAIAAGVRRISGGARKQRLQRGLVVAQVAVSVVLLAGAGLLTRTMLQLSDVETGLVTEEVLTIPVSLLDPSNVSVETDVANKALYDRMRREVAALPGVREVGLGSTMPLRAAMMGFDAKLDGRAAVPGEPTPHADMRTASPEYFRAAGIPLLFGRGFSATDGPGAARVVLVNQTFADKFYPGQNPIGRRIAWTGEVLKFTPVSGDWRTIVGIVGNTQDGGLDAAPRAAVFAPWAQEFAMLGGLVVRADSNAAGLATAATRIVRRIVPTIPVENVLTVRQIREQSIAPRRLNAMLVSLFGILAVIIAAVGIAGVLAFSVSARTSEIGIRMSLGAASGRVQRMILREGGALLLVGLALGTVGAVFAARVIRGLLFGVAPHDPATFAAVVATMLAIGVGACWIPARRAARIDPVITMRS